MDRDPAAPPSRSPLNPSPPAAARRLFTAYDPAGMNPIFVASRLLEDGDSADLRWLTASMPEPELAAWLERHGGRQLSRRSLAFWALALGRPAPRAGAMSPADMPPDGAADTPLPRTAFWPL